MRGVQTEKHPPRRGKKGLQEREDHALDKRNTDEGTHDTDTDRHEGREAGIDRVKNRLHGLRSHSKSSNSFTHCYTSFTEKLSQCAIMN